MGVGPKQTIFLQEDDFIHKIRHKFLCMIIYFVGTLEAAL